MTTLEEKVTTNEGVESEKSSKSNLVVVIVLLLIIIASLSYLFNKQLSGISWLLTHTVKAKLLPTAQPSSTPRVIKAKGTYPELVLKKGNVIETVYSFENFNPSTQPIAKWQNKLFFVEQLPSEMDPKPLQLVMYDLQNYTRKVIYRTEQYKAISDAYWNQPNKYGNYYFFMPLTIINDTLFFSIKTEGYDGSNPGPGAGYYFDLPIISEQPTQFSDQSGFFDAANGHYWYNDYVNPGAEETGERTYNLLDSNTKKITHIMTQPGATSADNGEYAQFVGITTKDDLIAWQENAVKTINLASPSKINSILDKSQIPQGTTDITLIPNTDQLLLVSDKAFYKYDIYNQKMMKLSDYNKWEGDKIIPTRIGDTEYNYIYTSYITADKVYIVNGLLGGGPTDCGIYYLNENRYTHDIEDEHKCYGWLKTYADILTVDESDFSNDSTSDYYDRIYHTLNLPNQFILARP